MLGFCSCIYCKEVRSSKGIFTHVDRAHLNSTKYSSGYNGRYEELSERRQRRIDDYLLNPNKCLQCDVGLTYAKKRNKFCSTSCSASYSNLRKDYSKFKTGPAKSRKPLQKHCEFCDKEFSTFKKDIRFCCKRCAIFAKNIPLRNKRTAWQNYRADCQFRFSLKNYPNEFDFNLIRIHGWYCASNRGNNLTGVSRDHMVSCRYGFDNNIPAEHIRHPANCRLIIQSENASKYKNNSISYDELLKRISDWEGKYGAKQAPPPEFRNKGTIAG